MPTGTSISHFINQSQQSRSSTSAEHPITLLSLDLDNANILRHFITDFFAWTDFKNITHTYSVKITHFYNPPTDAWENICHDYTYHYTSRDIATDITAKNGGGYMQRGVAKVLKVPCLFMITEVSIRCQKKPRGWYTAYTNLWVFLTAYTHLSDHK